MKSPLLPLIACIVIGGGAYAVFRKIDSSPEDAHLDKVLSETDRQHLEERLEEKNRTRNSRRSGMDRDLLDQRVAEMKRSLLEEFPILKIEERPVPDEENGFLQILKLENHPLAAEWEASGMWDELSACLDEWDAEKAKAFLQKYPSFVAELKRIASLTSQSSTLAQEHGYKGFVPAGLVKKLHDVCMLQMRLAAESGNESAALEAASDAAQIRNHLHDVERPSFNSETVVILLDLVLVKEMTKTLLPTLEASADLGVWRELMGGENHPPERLSQILRGEWHSDLMFEFLLNEPHHSSFVDRDETARIWSMRAAWWIAELEKKPSVGFLNLNGLGPMPDASSLSRAGQEMVEIMDSGSGSWVGSMLRSSVVTAQNRAVLDILIHEREGRAIPEMIEPVSGLPFRFDASTRTLHAPEWDGAPDSTPPVKLPW